MMRQEGKAFWKHSSRAFSLLQEVWKCSGQSGKCHAESGQLSILTSTCIPTLRPASSSSLGKTCQSEPSLSTSGVQSPIKDVAQFSSTPECFRQGEYEIPGLGRRESTSGRNSKTGLPVGSSDGATTSHFREAGGLRLFFNFIRGPGISDSANFSSFPQTFIVRRKFSACSHLARLASEAFAAASVIPTGGFFALNNLRDNPGSRQQKTRLGRGIGSGKGKTAGRGHKGQKARNGNKPRLGFEGGQTPLRLTLPKRGFHNPFSLSFQEVNLNTIARKISEGHIDGSQLITMKTLKDAGATGKAMRDGVKLLARGSENISLPLHIEVSRVSKRAKDAIEAAGGSVTRVHYNKLGLRALLKPEWFVKKGRLLPRPARPPPRLRAAVDAVGRLPAPTTPLPPPVEASSG